MATTKQVPNPEGRGGFGDNPQNRSNGRWKKEMVFSYQYKRFMNMTLKELDDYRTSPIDNRTVVEELAYQRVIAAKISLQDVKEITDRTEGKARESLDVTTGGESLNVQKLSDEELDERLRQYAKRHSAS